MIKRSKSKFYQNTKNTTDVWLTPPDLIKKLGKFDLDPCCPNNLKWKTAKNFYSLENNQDGLKEEWFGRVWLNPPYSNWAPFLKKLKWHGNGIALIFNKTETDGFFNYVWNGASGILFVKRRIRFFNSQGKQSSGSTCGSVLIAYGEENLNYLEKSGIPGKLIKLEKIPSVGNLF